MAGFIGRPGLMDVPAMALTHSFTAAANASNKTFT
jgi:hypothetical protein